MSKRSCFRTPFANERLNGIQTLLKPERHHYYPLFSSIRGKLSWKKSQSVLYKTLRLFVNALTADDKYSGGNMQNLPQQFQTPLSREQKLFADFLFHFWNVHEIYIIFKKKVSILSQLFPKLFMLKDVTT